MSGRAPGSEPLEYIKKNSMKAIIKHYKYLLFVTQLLLIGSVCNGQIDTIKTNLVIVENLEISKWHFTDTLVQKLIENDVYLNWKEIKILDQVYPKYINTITLKASEGKVLIVDSTGKQVNSISKKKINKQLNELVLQIGKSDSAYLNYNWESDPMEQYELDSIWFKNEIINIWDKYRKSEKIILDKNQIEIASKELLNYNSLVRILRTPSNWNRNESILVDFQVIYEFDTLHIQATSYFAFSLPWYYFNNQTRLANSNISKSVGNILFLIKRDSGNIDRMLGVNFEWLMIDDIYNRYLKEKLNVL